MRSGCRESEILPGVRNADQARTFNVQRLRFSTRSADEILSRMRREDAAYRLERRQIVLKSERRRRLAQLSEPSASSVACGVALRSVVELNGTQDIAKRRLEVDVII